MIYNCCDCTEEERKEERKKERKKERRKKENLFGIFLCFTAIADSLFLRYVTYLNSFISSVIFFQNVYKCCFYMI